MKKKKEKEVLSEREQEILLHLKKILIELKADLIDEMVRIKLKIDHRLKLLEKVLEKYSNDQ